jgi:hypothetical protein
MAGMTLEISMERRDNAINDTNAVGYHMET